MRKGGGVKQLRSDVSYDILLPHGNNIDGGSMAQRTVLAAFLHNGREKAKALF